MNMSAPAQQPMQFDRIIEYEDNRLINDGISRPYCNQNPAISIQEFPGGFSSTHGGKQRHFKIEFFASGKNLMEAAEKVKKYVNS